MIRKEELIDHIEDLCDVVVNHKDIQADLVAQINRLHQAIDEARTLMYDYDGYYDKDNKAGDAEGLGKLIDEVDDLLYKAMYHKLIEAVTKVNTKQSTTLERLAESKKMDYEFLYLKTKKLQEENDALHSTIELLEADLDHVTTDRNNLSDSSTRVTNNLITKMHEREWERDDARREVCTWESLTRHIPKEDVAKLRGWDCFPRSGELGLHEERSDE